MSSNLTSKHPAKQEPQGEGSTSSSVGTPASSARFASLKPYWLGITFGAALAVLLSTLSLIALLTPNLDYGVVILILLAIVVGVPLCIALLVTWLTYRRRTSVPLPAKLHAAMFVPTFVALSVLPMGSAVQDTARKWFKEAHPDIRELHVNFSGRPLWLVLGSAQTDSGAWPNMPLQSGTEAKFVSFTRHPQKDEIAEARFPYVGSRLRESGHSYAYAEKDENGRPVAVRPRPLVLRPYPSLGWLPSDVRESKLLVYQYFHYYDHVDVAPGLTRLDSSELTALQARLGNVVSFYLSDQHSQGLARLEVNGQTLVLGVNGEIILEEPCHRLTGFAGSALLDIEKPLTVRWQTLGDPSRWHEARVSVPAFHDTASPAVRAAVRNVRLYFLDNDAVAAEQLRTLSSLSGERRTITTGVPAGAQIGRNCDTRDRNNIDVFSG